jgi:hypothetical protein
MYTRTGAEAGDASCHNGWLWCSCVLGSSDIISLSWCTQEQVLQQAMQQWLAVVGCCVLASSNVYFSYVVVQQPGATAGAFGISKNKAAAGGQTADNLASCTALGS